MKRTLNIPGLPLFEIVQNVQDIAFQKDFKKGQETSYLASGFIHLTLSLPTDQDKYDFIRQWFSEISQNGDAAKKTIKYQQIYNQILMVNMDYVGVAPKLFELKNIEDPNTKEIIGQKILIMLSYDSTVDFLEIPEEE